MKFILLMLSCTSFFMLDANCLIDVKATLLSNEPLSNGGRSSSDMLHSANPSASSIPSSNSDAPKDPSGLAAANACWSQWEALSLSSAHCLQTTTTIFPSSIAVKYTSIVFETFKLCDGHPRAVVDGGDRTSIITDTIGFPGSHKSIFSTITEILPPSGIPLSTITTVDTSIDSYLVSGCVSTLPTPTCSIGPAVCGSLFSAWTAGHWTRIRPPCTVPVSRHACEQCVLSVPSVRLMYFPVSMTGNFCGNYSTVTPTPTEGFTTPSTVQISGFTFTSGFAYLSYAGVTALGAGGNCGPTKPAGILALPSSDVFSYRGHAAALPIAGDVQWPFNFADLAPNPVPWDAWISQESCAGHTQFPYCQTITQAAYRPGIVYPRQFWSMEPEWSNCISGAFGIVDPPTALPVAQVVAIPTYARATTSRAHSAVPHGTRSQGLPRITTTHYGRTSPAPDGKSSSVVESLSRDGSYPISTSRLGQIHHPEPSVELTFAEKTFTAYSGGVLRANTITLIVPPREDITVDGHVLGFMSQGVLVDSKMYRFQTTQSSSTSADPINVKTSRTKLASGTIFSTITSGHESKTAPLPGASSLSPETVSSSTTRSGAVVVLIPLSRLAMTGYVILLGLFVGT